MRENPKSCVQTLLSDLSYRCLLYQTCNNQEGFGEFFNKTASGHDYFPMERPSSGHNSISDWGKDTLEHYEIWISSSPHHSGFSIICSSGTISYIQIVHLCPHTYYWAQAQSQWASPDLALKHVLRNHITSGTDGNARYEHIPRRITRTHLTVWIQKHHGADSRIFLHMINFSFDEWKVPRLRF